MDRCLTLLRNKIRERGFTQLEVQDALSWGRSYISQLLTRQKKLRLDQVLMILTVISVKPEEFFAELYLLPRPSWSNMPPGRSMGQRQTIALGKDLEEFGALLQGLTRLLVEKGIVASDEVIAATEAEAQVD